MKRKAKYEIYEIIQQDDGAMQFYMIVVVKVIYAHQKIKLISNWKVDFDEM